ncbi:uncharacterized protein ACNS7B_023551 isoform 2-T2 [Menidia menidia]
MEKKYPSLKRPKRKLCYITDKESPSKQWTGALSLEDVDKMFDDIDSCTPLHPPSPLLQSSDTETNPSETQLSVSPQQKHPTEKPQEHQTALPNQASPVTLADNKTQGPDGDSVDHSLGSLSPKLDINFDIPFKANGHVKTSSPIEKNIDVKEQDNKNDQVVSPILFNCEDEVVEELNKDSPVSQKPHCNGLNAEESADLDLESPPSRVTLTKKSSHKMKAKEPQAHNGQNDTDLPASTVRQDPEFTAPEDNAKNVSSQPSEEMSSRVGKHMMSFLEKLKLVGKPGLTCKKSPVKAPPPAAPPEPEDNFLILEDDAPLWFSIPSKSTTNKRPQLSKTSSNDKEHLTDNRSPDSLLENQQEQHRLETPSSKDEDQSVTKKKKKNSEVTGPKNDGEADLQDLPTGDMVEQPKAKKKKQQLRKSSSKLSDKKEDQPKNTPKENTSLETKTKAHKLSEKKMLKVCKENTRTGKASALKEARERSTRLGAVKEMEQVDLIKEQSQEQRSTEPSDSEAQGYLSDERTTGNKQPGASSGSVSEDAGLLGKRKRRKTGQWWLNSPQDTEETESQQPTIKRSKQKNKEPNPAGRSPAKARNEKVNKKISQKQPAKIPSKHSEKSKQKKTKQNKKRNGKGDEADKIKAAGEIFSADEAEPEQQDICNQDLDPQQSIPLVFSHRDHSLSSGGQIFQRVYHGSSDKISAPASPKQPREQLTEAEAGKRRRRPPGTWWSLKSGAKDSESVDTQPQNPTPKGPKGRQRKKSQPKQRKSSGLGAPQNGNVLVPVKPAGGAPVPPLSAPKTVKRSLATFKNIFTSGIETPSAVSDRDAHQSSRCHVTPHPAEVISATSFITGSRAEEDKADGAIAGCTDHDAPQDGECQSEDTLKVLRSGPSSMIELEQYEENDDIILPSSRVQAALSVSDLCAPPLKPLSLHPNDKANLTEWFQSLWSTSADDGASATPEQFDWYSYQDRALGFQVDLNSGSICSGKILLGSHMKKPLWVDHSATTVFNLLTSSVSVTIDGGVSRYRSGQAFMVECGRAYSIHNNKAQPAVLYFTRVLADSPD